MGFEPTTLCVQSRCSSNWSYTPINWRLKGRYKITNRQNYHALIVPWWTRRDSNPQPSACKAVALPIAPQAHLFYLENLIKRILPVFILYSYNATHYSAIVTISLSPRAVALKLLTAVPKNPSTKRTLFPSNFHPPFRKI